MVNTGNTRLAIKLLKAFIAKNERNSLAHWYLGEVYYKERKYELAIVEYKYVIKLGIFTKELSEAMVRKRLAAIYKEFNQLDEAQKEFIMLSNLEPDNFNVLYEIGELFYKRNLIENAVVYFQKAMRINPQHSDSHYYLGIIYFNTGKFEEAQIELSKAVQLDQHNYKARLFMGMVYKAMGNFDNASREFEIAQRDPEVKVRALLENGKVLYERENLSKSIVELERALKFSNTEDDLKMEAHYWLANCYEKNRDIPEAIEQWETIANNRSSYKDVSEKLAVYADLRTDDRLKDFLTASKDNFQTICEKLVNVMGYSITEVLSRTDEGMDAIIAEAETKMRYVRRRNGIIKIRRVTKPIGELLIREIHEEMKRNSATRGIVVTTATFAPSAVQYASTRPVDLVDKKELTEHLKKIEDYHSRGS